MSDPIKIVFPSGLVQYIENSPREQLAKPRAKTKRTAAHKHACKHVGSAISIPQGCSGKNRSVWECAVYGQCAPLAIFRGTPGKPSCLYCESYEPSPSPGLLAEMKSAADATAKWIAAGSPVRPSARQDEALAACHACPHLRRGKLGEWCGQCGCYLKAKVMMATESCPLKPPRWTST